MQLAMLVRQLFMMLINKLYWKLDCIGRFPFCLVMQIKLIFFATLFVHWTLVYYFADWKKKDYHCQIKRVFIISCSIAAHFSRSAKEVWISRPVRKLWPATCIYVYNYHVFMYLWCCRHICVLCDMNIYIMYSCAVYVKI